MITLLIATFVISFVVASIVVFIFTPPVDRIVRRVIQEDVSRAWTRYLQFAIYVVGIGSGTQVWSLQKYLSPPAPGERALELTRDRWVLEVYGSVIQTLQSIAMMLLVFFVFALLALVIVRDREARRGRPEAGGQDQPNPEPHT